MTSHHCGDQEGSNQEESAQRALGPIDFTFLDVQTDGDRALEREVLALFLTQARRLIPTLPRLSAREQGDVAHLLKGSARGIGAWAFADETADYEAAEAGRRRVLFPRLAAAFERAETAIIPRLAEAPQAGTAPEATI